MAKRKVYHVVPDAEGKTWKVKGEGSERAVSVHKKKEAAEKAAAKLAKKQPLGQVIIHGLDGKVLEEHTYGEDPKSKG